LQTWGLTGKPLLFNTTVLGITSTQGTSLFINIDASIPSGLYTFSSNYEQAIRWRH
jgi:hypothetical protein